MGSALQRGASFRGCRTENWDGAGIQVEKVKARQQRDVEVVSEDHLVRHRKDGPKSAGIVQVRLDLGNGESVAGVLDNLAGESSTRILVLNIEINHCKLDLSTVSWRGG
jgi:hypothetical protein